MTATAPVRRTGLRDFYENPAVPVASGTPRSLRQARMLAAALGPAGRTPRTILDIGCGDGTAAATAAPCCPATASSASTGRRTRSAAPGPAWRTRCAVNSGGGGCRSDPARWTPCCSAR